MDLELLTECFNNIDTMRQLGLTQSVISFQSVRVSVGPLNRGWFSRYTKLTNKTWFGKLMKLLFLIYLLGCGP